MVLWKSYLGLGSFTSRHWDKDSRASGLFRRLSQNEWVEEWEAQVWRALWGTDQIPSGRKAVSITRRASAFSPPWRLSLLKKITSPIVRPSIWHSPHPVTNLQGYKHPTHPPQHGKTLKGHSSSRAPERSAEASVWTTLQSNFSLYYSGKLPFHRVDPRRTS